jgi:transcriptional regulator with XRE-family HTH domain
MAFDRPDPTALGRLRTGLLIREARTTAGLTQSELAGRVGTKQSVISRWERGIEEPRIGTLARLLRACGFEVDLAFRRLDDVDRAQIAQHLAMTPSQRLRSLENVAAFVASAHRKDPVDA